MVDRTDIPICWGARRWGWCSKQAQSRVNQREVLTRKGSCSLQDWGCASLRECKVFWRHWLSLSDWGVGVVRPAWSQTAGFKGRSTVSGRGGNLLSAVKWAALENLSTKCVHTFYSCFTKDKVSPQGGSRTPYITPSRSSRFSLFSPNIFN